MKGYLILTELQRVVPDWPHLTFTPTNHFTKYTRWFDIPIPYMDEKHWSDNTKARWMTADLFPICKFCNGSIFSLIRSRKGNITDSLLTWSSSSVLRKARKIAKRRWGFCAWYLVIEFHSLKYEWYLQSLLFITFPHRQAWGKAYLPIFG